MVDDRPENLLSIVTILEDLDADLVTASNGQEALELILDGDFAVVLLDAHMPEIDGFEVVHLMSGVQSTRKIPIIFISAIHKDERHVFEGYNLGAVDYLFKPIEPDILRGKVTVFLDLFRQREIIRQQAAELKRVNEEMERRVAERTHELSEAEKARRQSEDAMRSLFVHSPDLIVSLDFDGEVRFVNRPESLAQFSHLKVGDQFANAVQSSSRSRFLRGFRRAILGGDRSAISIAMENERWLQIRFSRIGGQNQEPVILVFATDVTEVRALQLQAMRNAHLVTVGILAASIAHEVNNPNNAIGFNANLLRNISRDAMPILHQVAREQGPFELGGIPFEEMDETVPRLIGDIEKNAQRIKEIVSNLKRMARNEGSGQRTAVNFQHVVDASCAILDNAIRKHSAQVAINLPDSLPLALGNQVQLEQVFINLILNALQALPTSGGEVRVYPAERSPSGRVGVVVEDNGCGMTREQLRLAMEPFYTTRQESGGTGLGLSICHKLLTDLDGDLEFSPRPHGGVRATVILPQYEPGLGAPDDVI
ncbi:putative sensor histidine kinase, PAS domain-containing [Magnetofaba australis IT-1]|uniref:histidine kinase n=1 Tax=Magnetofaba australis IT-1 TaxID=1434232 RepID=A0A1Y2K6I9_9PROT|nr:putative sensor histidine kinase, PAS domain-containing [Magnetofaba australis IT-1]